MSRNTRIHTIRKIELSTGIVTTVVGTVNRSGVVLGPLPAQLGSPEGLTFVPNRGLFITDEGAVLVADL